MVLVGALVCTASACSGNEADRVHAGEVYDAAVRWFAAERTDDPDPLRVFVESRGEGATIPLDVQAQVVRLSADVADVRFIDARSEALIDLGDGTLAVRDGGVLIRLGPVPEKGRRLDLDIDRWLDGATFESLRFALGKVVNGWLVVRDPVGTGRFELPG
jgi:hypothetical protein